MVAINGITAVYLGKVIPTVKITSRGMLGFYKSLDFPVGKPLTPGTIKVEVAKLWKVGPSEVVILENVEVPKI